MNSSAAWTRFHYSFLRWIPEWNINNYVWCFSDKVILNNALDLDKGSSDIGSALKYFNSITDYMMQLRNALGELRDDIEWETELFYFRHKIFIVCFRSVAQDELNAADQEKMIGIAILSFISLVTLVFYFFVKNALSVIRVSYCLFANVNEHCGLLQGFRQRSHGKSQRTWCWEDEDGKSFPRLSPNIRGSRHEETQGS